MKEPYFQCGLLDSTGLAEKLWGWRTGKTEEDMTGSGEYVGGQEASHHGIDTTGKD